MSDVIVVGAGMAGLVAAIRLRKAGASVTLVSKGVGGIQLGQGSIDVLGYAPERVADPLALLGEFAEAHPEHPYATLDADAVRLGVEYLRELLPGLLVGDADRNVLLPTAAGALRPTALIQPSMAEGVVRAGNKYVFVGLKQLKDFWPELIAGNVARTPVPSGGRLEARAVWLDMPARGTAADSSPLTYARAMDEPGYRTKFVTDLKRVVQPGEIVGVPGVLGMSDRGAFADIREQLGQPIFEISTIPPSVPGMRINDELVRIATALRVRMIKGSKVLSAVTEGSRIAGLVVGTTGRPTTFRADHVVFAPGGFESGALAIDSHMRVHEPALDLPVEAPQGDLFVADHNAPQPAFSSGVRTDKGMRVLDSSGVVVHDNLHAAGGILAGAYRWREKSGEGIALASAVRAADTILGATNG